MAKSTRDRDRRAVVEQMRREQERAEKKRRNLIVAVSAVIALVIVGLGAYPLLVQNRASAGSLASLGQSADQAGCQDIETKPANGGNDHRTEGTRIFYEDAPPAFGPHYPAPAGLTRKYYTVEDRPPVEELVHNLEHGYTLLWYDPTVADNGDDLTVVKAIANKFSGSDMKDKFIAVPWTDKDGKGFPKGMHVALTHWSLGGTNGNDKGDQGIWQYCAAPSGEAVADFVKKYPYSDSPEPTAM